MSRRFVLVPGRIVSKSDGDEHYIGPVQLASLYHLRLSECIVDYGDGRYRPRDGDVRLYPLYRGDYFDARALLQDGPPNQEEPK